MASEKNPRLEKPKHHVAKPEPKKEPDNTQKLFQMSNISLWLDDYTDLFSDFDPRPFSQRTLSDDFMAEAKKVSREKKDKFELRLLVPVQKRNTYNEGIIRKRILEQFRSQHDSLNNEVKKTLVQGATFLTIGIFLMFLATYLIFEHYETNFVITFFSTLFEPAIEIESPAYRIPERLNATLMVLESRAQE